MSFLVAIFTAKATGRCPAGVCTVPAYQLGGVIGLAQKLVPVCILGVFFVGLEITAADARTGCNTADSGRLLPADFVISLANGVYAVGTGILLRVAVYGYSPVTVVVAALIHPILGYISKRLRLRTLRLLKPKDIVSLAAARVWTIRCALQSQLFFFFTDLLHTVAPGRVLRTRETLQLCVRDYFDSPAPKAQEDVGDGNATAVGWRVHEAACQDVRYGYLHDNVTYNLMISFSVAYILFHVIATPGLVNFDPLIAVPCRLFLFALYLVVAYNLALLFAPREIVTDGAFADAHDSVTFYTYVLYGILLCLVGFRVAHKRLLGLMKAFGRAQSYDVFISLRFAEAAAEATRSRRR